MAVQTKKTLTNGVADILAQVLIPPLSFPEQSLKPSYLISKAFLLLSCNMLMTKLKD